MVEKGFGRSTMHLVHQGGATSPTSQPKDGELQLQLLCQGHPGLFSLQAQQTPHCGCTRLRAVGQGRIAQYETGHKVWIVGGWMQHLS
jgi:hypothetical protein